MRVTASDTPPLDLARLKADISEIARRAAPARLGVGLMNLDSGEVFTFEGERPFPLSGLAVLPIAVAALAEADAGRLLPTEIFDISEEHLSPPPSPIAQGWPARRSYTARDLWRAAIAGDNTAADVLMKRIGGPGAVTAWLQGARVPEVRVDRYAREIVTETYGLASFRPEWRTEASFAAALAAEPPEQRLAAMRARAADPRDTASPRGMLDFLLMLNRFELAAPGSTRRLLQALARASARRQGFRAGLPRNAGLARLAAADRADLGMTPAAGEAAIFTLSGGRAYALAAFLIGAPGMVAQEAVFAEVARAAAAGVG